MPLTTTADTNGNQNIEDYFIAKKNIQVGEELYVDYGREYWRKKKIQ